MELKTVKREIRIVGVDDAPLVTQRAKRVGVFGVVYRGGYWFDGLMRTDVEVDGIDATERIAQMILISRHFKQLRITMLHGLTFAGMNMVNLKTLYDMTQLPTIVVMDRKPRIADFEKAIEKLENSQFRKTALNVAGEITQIRTKLNAKPIYVQFIGLKLDQLKEVMNVSCTRSRLPEPVRVAHMVASTGEIPKRLNSSRCKSQ